MQKTNSPISLPSVLSDEEYETVKLKNTLFQDAARVVIDRHHLPNEPLLPLEGTNIVFSCGNYIIKIYPPLHQSHYETEVLVMKHVHQKISVSTPAVQHTGEISGWPYLVMTRVEGTLLEGLWETLDESNKAILLKELGALIKEVHSLPIDGLASIDCHWPEFIQKKLEHCVKQHQDTHLPEPLLRDLPRYLESAHQYLPILKNPVILTGEYTPMNLLVTQTAGIWHITGLIDFGDSMLGLPEYDLLGPGVFLIQGNKMLLKTFLLAYGYKSTDMTPALSRQLTMLMLLHRYSNLNIQIRIKNWKDKVQTISELEDVVWGF